MMRRLLVAAILVTVGSIGEADEMTTSQVKFCERLAAAPSAEAELAVLQARSELPPPQRSLRYGIRRISDGTILHSDEFTPDMLDAIEVVLYCDDGGAEREVVWKPKSMESLEALMRE
jgi:hypothetical protein